MVFSRTRILAFFVFTVVLGFGLWCLYGYLAVRGIETPSYTVETAYADYEIRHYEPMILATTTVDGDLDSATVAGFKRVAAYIFGDNSLQKNIAMTAPVTTEQAHAVRDGETPSYSISFIMPSLYEMGDLPLPKDPQVRVVSLPARTIAVLTFSGIVHEEELHERMAAFAAELEEKGYTVSGELGLAQYNPPFTPWFLRKNEIWAEVLMRR